MTEPKKSKGLDWEIKEAVRREGVPEPIPFLVAIMAGRDPRPGIGALKAAVLKAEESEVKGQPEAEFWDKVKEMVLYNPLYEREPVAVQDSQSASKELLSYQHSKKKAVHVSGSMEHLVTVEPLTAKEAELVDNELFDDFGG